MECPSIICRLAGRVAGSVICALLAGTAPSRAAVVVIANDTPGPIVTTVLVEGETPRQLALDAADCRPVFANAPVRVRVGDNASAPAIAVEPDCAYTVRGKAPGLRLNKIPLGEAAGRAWPQTKPLLQGLVGRSIDVKILVDEDERRPRPAWEPALRARIAAASDALVAHGGVPLRVVAIDQWNSNNAESDFHRSLTEFVQETSPAPAQLAIGFSSQYELAKGRIHLGGTRGALYSHILIKERAGHVLDPERLELLVHELGHVMGATHSDDPRSVMRPVVGQGQMRLAGAKLRFDAANTLLVSLMGQEIREHGIRSLHDASPAVRRRMGEIYKALDPNLPDDPATGNYLALLNAAGVEPLVKDTRRVIEQIVRVAKIEHDKRATGSGGETAPLADDKLLEYYVRQAALAAKQVRRENGPRALVLALGVAIDDTGQLRKLPLVSAVEGQLEGESDRTDRLAVLGAPTMRGRADLAKHFFVSAHLVALIGSEAARNAGLVKEVIDANGGSGFSFRDMTANRAGIVFAHAVLSGALSLDEVASEFTVESFLPPVDDLREQMQAAEFFKAFGGAGDQRLMDELSRIETRISQLPAYASAAAAEPAK